MSEQSKWTNPETYGKPGASAIDKYIGEVEAVTNDLQQLVKIQDPARQEYLNGTITGADYDRLVDEIQRHALVTIKERISREEDERNLNAVLTVVSSSFGEKSHITKEADEMIATRRRELKRRET